MRLGKMSTWTAPGRLGAFLLTTDCLLPTTYCLLLTTYYLLAGWELSSLHTAYYFLLTTYYCTWQVGSFPGGDDALPAQVTSSTSTGTLLQDSK